MFQAITLVAVITVTAQGFDLKKSQLPTNSLVNLGKIDVSVYYNTPNGKPEHDSPPLNDLFQGALPLAPIPAIPSIAPQQVGASCPCSHMKSFGKDPSLSMLSKLFGGISMNNDTPQSPNCCELFEIIEDDVILPLNGNMLDLEPFQLGNNPFPPLPPTKLNSQYRPKAVEIVIIPNKKNMKHKHNNAPREDIRVVGGEKKFSKLKKNKSKARSGDRSAKPEFQNSNFEYGVSNVEIVLESKPVNEPAAPAPASSESGKNNSSVKKDLNSQKSTTVASSTTTGDVTTTRTRASPADVE